MREGEVPQKPTIGFAGLGLMGRAMCERLLDLGYPLTVTAHRAREGVEACLARGAREVSGPAGLAAADIVMICVGTSAQVETVMEGPHGLLAALRPGQVVIDFGTSEPASTRRLAALAEARGAAYMDAPLGRTPAQAREGRLNIMAAGTPELFARVRPVLADLGENVFHVGPTGAGHTLKLMNNFFGMTTAMAMCEAFAMGDLAGLPRQALYEVMAAGPLRSGMMDFVKAEAIDHEVRLAFSVANGAKDVGYYRSMAQAMGVPSLMSGAADAVLGRAEAEGWGQKMVPEMVHFFEELYRK
jgi:3-hydroxyisobutyrate dehydrogenase-like beta-hydroxyacid dehydrogenase